MSSSLSITVCHAVPKSPFCIAADKREKYFKTISDTNWSTSKLELRVCAPQRKQGRALPVT